MPGDMGSAGKDHELRPYHVPTPVGDRPLFLELMRVFATRLKVFLAVVVIVILGTVYQMMKATPIYRASGQILVERQTSRLGNLDDPLEIDTLDTDYYNTQFKILEGPGLSARVSKVLNLQAHPAFAGSNPVFELQANTEVVWLRNNRIFEVAFYHWDRELAAQIVNTLIAEYKADTIQRRTEAIRELRRQMLQELDKERRDLEENERSLLEFYKKHGLHMGEEKQATLNRLMEEVAVQLAREESELNELEAIGGQIEAAGQDLQKLAGLQAVVDNQAMRDMRLEEARVHTELEEMRKKFGPEAEQRRIAEARATEITHKIGQQIRTIAEGLLLQREVKRKGIEKTRGKYEEIKKQRIEMDALVWEADQLRRARDASRSLYDTLMLRIKESEISSGIETTNIHLLHAAEVPLTPVRPNLMVSLMMGFIVAIVAGAGVTLLLEKADNTIRTPEDVEMSYGLSVLSVVPERKPDEQNIPPPLVSWQDERSQMAEAYRRLRAAILLSVRAGEGGSIRKILFCSPGPGEGKTVSSINTATCLAQMGARTLLLDTDFYRSESHKLFGLDREKGLSTLLTSDIDIAQAIQPTPIPFLDYMATGMIPPQPASLLASARMKWVLDELSKTYARIVIDSSPLIAVTDASMLAPHMDALIMVTCQGKTLKTALRRSLQTLSRIGVRPLGVVFNGVKVGVGEFYFKYHHPTYALEENERVETTLPQ